MLTKKAVKRGYKSPRVTVAVTFDTTPPGYIKHLPIKGTVSARDIASAVKLVIAARTKAVSGGFVTMEIPKYKIIKGERVRILGIDSSPKLRKRTRRSVLVEE